MHKILVIEDNKKLAEFIQIFLVKKGFQPDIALDGVTGLQSFATGSYDLLIVDMKLPRMDGSTLCEKVRASEKGKDLPIIAISGIVKEPSEMEALRKDLKLYEYLTKPFSFDSLHSTINKALTEKKPAIQQPKEAAAGPVPPQQTQASTVQAKAPVPKEEGHDQQKGFRGKLSEKHFEEVLSFIYERKLSGILLVGIKEKKKKIFINRGAPIDVATSSVQDDFGNYLLKKGLISMVELGVYEDEKKAVNSDPRSIFIKMGCLTPQKFREEEDNYLSGEIEECFSWFSGMFAFEPKTSFLPESYYSSSLIPQIFFRGFRKNLNSQRVEGFLTKKGKFYLRKTQRFFDYQNQLLQIPKSGMILHILDGTKTCSDMISSLDINDETALAIILTLDHLKMASFSQMPGKVDIKPSFPVRERVEEESVEAEKEEAAVSLEFEDLGEEMSMLSDELEGLETMHQPQAGADAGAAALEDELKATWERIKDKNYYEIFGLTKHTYSFNTLKSAYFDLTRKFSPDKFFASSGEMMSLDQDLLSKVAEAYETLSNVVSKENYDEYLDSQEAVSMGAGGEDDKMKIQVQFTSGKVFLEEGQFESAEKAFTNLVNMVPDKPEYLTYLALAVYNNPAHRRSNVAVSKAKDLINRSLKLGKLSMTYALKGTMLFDEGNLSLAEAEFNKALRINPSNKTALKKMEEIIEKREQEKGGLLKRMFK